MNCVSPFPAVLLLCSVQSCVPLCPATICIFCSLQGGDGVRVGWWWGGGGELMILSENEGIPHSYILP